MRPLDPVEMHLGYFDTILSLPLEERLTALDPKKFKVELGNVDPGESHSVLTGYLRPLLTRALEGMEGEERLKHQAKLCNMIIHLLSDRVDKDFADETVSDKPRRLLSVLLANQPKTDRPDTPLGIGCLLTGTRLDPSLVSQLRKEVQTADCIDVLCSFIKWSGIRILEESLKDFATKPGARLRVITTSYLGATDLKAIDRLSALPNTEIRISYDTNRTRLHAKAYLFHRATGFSSAYVGSSNLSHAALTDGLEWNVKISQYESRHLWDKVSATFETYWNDSEFTPYNTSERPRLQTALFQEHLGAEAPEQPVFFSLHPYAFQKEILDRLDAERRLQGRNRHLVVAATGTGKTIIAAFDYRHWSLQVNDAGGNKPRLLFVAHREELLQQSLYTFRMVLRDNNFGDLLVGGKVPEKYDHLFVSIQSYNSQRLAEQFPSDHFAYVVVDEFHHAAAPSYERMLEPLRPQILLGLTATPERADGLDVLRHFGGHISAQIRLPDAINRKLLSPFQYFGVTDSIDLSCLKWQRGGYRTDELDRILTGNDLRAALVIQKVQEILLDPSKACGLGFCVSVAHARYMSEKFNQHNIPSDTLSGESDDKHRKEVRTRLKEGKINFLFVVDLYNEGIDIPEIDTVLFLRPTESLTIFLQQLGRGLRLCDNKHCLTVLDLIGRPHRNFRFDLRYRALLTDPLLSVANQIELGFTHLPAGCTILMEKVASRHVLENIGKAIKRSTLVSQIADMAKELGRSPGLAEFLERYDLKTEEIYRRGVSWSHLCAEAGVREKFNEPDVDILTQGLRRIQHISSAHHIQSLLRLLKNTGENCGLNELDERRLLMLDLCLFGRGGLPQSATDSFNCLKNNPTMRNELFDLLRYRFRCSDEVPPPLLLPFPTPLSLHALYTRDEILAALGHWTRENQKEMREGVLYIPAIKTDVFLFSLNKTEQQFSPTTMYEDYAINEQLFHWQSQSTTSPEAKTGQRYINHKKMDVTILLFGREDQKAHGLAVPYSFLGPAQYVSHVGSRPMSITWRLDHPLPAKLLRRMARLSVG